MANCVIYQVYGYDSFLIWNVLKQWMKLNQEDTWCVPHNVCFCDNSSRYCNTAASFVTLALKHSYSYRSYALKYLELFRSKEIIYRSITGAFRHHSSHVKSQGIVNRLEGNTTLSTKERSNQTQRNGKHISPCVSWGLDGWDGMWWCRFFYFRAPSTWNQEG